VTVHSPPEMSATGACHGEPYLRISCTSAAITFATSAASPVTVSPRITALMFCLANTCAAASSERCAVAITLFVTFENAGSPGFGVSSSHFSSRVFTEAGGRTRSRASTSSASAQVVGSGAQGPDAMCVGSSPVTSEMISASTGARDAAARRPPWIAERCLRTVLISWMVAPLFRS
jgi:hypothetical protein